MKVSLEAIMNYFSLTTGRVEPKPFGMDDLAYSKYFLEKNSNNQTVSVCLV